MFRCGLSTLPESLSQLTKLSKLDIGRNKLTTFPEAILSLKSLTELDMLDCGLSTLPESLSQLTKLSKLDIRGNKLTTFPEAISSLKSLTELDMWGCDLSTLPERLQSLTQLSFLDLSDNDFSEDLPECVAELCSLKVLHLGSCKLSSLPDKLKSLTQLSILHLSDNDFSRGLPECVTELCSLKELYLARCKLSSLPVKLQSLTQLSLLDLSLNDFSKGLPECVAELCSLKELRLGNCKLSSLPDELANLRAIVKIDLYCNKFKNCPPVICKLSQLQELILGRIYGEDQTLKTLNSNLLNLHYLKVIDCTDCKALISPPYAVCKQGLQAIFQFYNDMRDRSGKQQIISTVAVIGELMSGKTSLIRSLKKGERELTYRNIKSVVDDTTKVFEMNELELQNNHLRIVDFGGHEVYHMAYQMTLKDNCIPLIVVNMEQYCTLRAKEKVEAKEASRRVCFNWMSHLYLSCPRLGRPFLILTHKDKLDNSKFELLQIELVDSLEFLRKEFMHEQTELVLKDESTYILHFDKKNTPLFHSEDIFALGNDAHDLPNLNRLKASLDCYVEKSEIEIPQLWQQMGNYIDSQTDKPFLTLSEIQKTYPEPARLVVLRYLHNIGKILWYEKQKSLDSYIFHKISEITDMIALLFHHKGFEQWDERLKNFKVFSYKQSPIDLNLYEELITEFKNSGQLDDAILVHIFDKESKIGYDTAMAILKSFNIVHGPIKRNPRPVFILPSLSSRSKSPDIAEEGDLQLKAEIAFEGLTLPKYVYHLLTVAVLNMHDDSDTMSYKSAYANGAEIQQENITTHLLHDFDNRRLLVQVSTSLCKIARSWKLLEDTCKTIVSCSKKKCKATRPVVRLFCSHCLFARDPNPGTKSKIEWVYPGAHQTSCHDEAKQYFIGKCFKHASIDKPSVPSPLLVPCKVPNKKETQSLQTYLKGLKRFPHRTSQRSNGDSTPSAPAGASSSNPFPSLQRSGIAYKVCKAADETRDSQSVQTKDDEESDLSDVEKEGYVNSEWPNEILSLRLAPCRKKNITRLYDTPKKIYPMTEPIRGKVLIINNYTFYENRRESSKRLGSDVDYKNMSRLFREMRFQPVKSEDKLTDLTAVEIYKEIAEETARSEHHKLGMFVLVLMSHGVRRDHILDIDLEHVDLVKIKDMLSSHNFPAMEGKPKLVVIQACSGDRENIEDSLEVNDGPQATRDVTDNPNSPLPDSTETCSTSAESLVSLPGDDFFVMKASLESFAAARSETHGSWFIRILVATFYRHACHRDLESLFKVIQQRMRKVSVDHTKRTGDRTAGNVPTSVSTFTNYRKLYFFPEFPVRSHRAP